MDRASTFGLWLKQRRKAGDLTQEQLAERVGCAAETLRKIETDARRPSRAMVDRIAQVLEVPPAERPALIQWARTGTTSALADQPARPAATTQPRAAGPLLRTKLYLPRVRAQGVARPRLLAQLDHGMTGRLTALVAPPGFGKTTLLAEWANQWAATSDGRNVAWLTLDAADSEPEQFLRYLIAALRTVAPEIGGTALRLIAAGDASHIAAALPLLLNDLDELPGETVLILDDYHAIAASAVHESVSALLDHLPPHLHLIIASRADPPLPLARLRVRGELAELRAADLRFTPAETAAFLHDSMRLPLAPGDIATLGRRTEGWAAGLQLAGLSLQGQSPEQITAFVAAFGGSHHYIVDYLIDEVLSKQPAPLQRFLLHTAILERLCGALCDAVLGQAASAAGPDALSGQDILRELERKQLFVVPLDDEWRWFRFHQLFADVLRERLARTVAPEQIALLHRRAAQWHAAHGATGVAVRHALAAHDWELAADLIERASGVGMPGDLQHGETLRAWLDALPASVVRARPKLCLLRARHALLSDLEQAAEWSRHAEQA
jgi:LuxR family maltose regulon positive regulatory protein